MSSITSGHPANSIRRDGIELAAWGVTRRGEIWVLPDDAPEVLIGMVDVVCERRPQMDYKFQSDV